MINIQHKTDCCGCHACATVCAKHCITMLTDEEGFLYPVVDKDACTDCGLCERVCPVINQSDPRKPLKVYAAKNKNEEIRRQSSSGGIFTLLAEKVIGEGGVVFGARFDDEWNVVHSWADTIEGVAAFRGSKYVQSTIGNAYREVKDFLKQGRKVLFSGTPCQIAGLKKFLRKDYDNLLTVDVVCHGVPSPGVWRRYLDELRAELRAERGVGKNTVPSSIDELPVITGISFRDKTNGWKKYGFRLCYAASEAVSNSVPDSAIKEEKQLLQPFRDNLFMQGFLANLYLRPSCYACAARSGKSGSDISIADFWGVQNYYPEFDDDKGVGLVLINSEKGGLVYDSIDSLNVEATYEQGFEGNNCIENSVKLPKFRSTFFSNTDVSLIEYLSFIIKEIRPNVILRIFRPVLGKVKRLLMRIYFQIAKRK